MVFSLGVGYFLFALVGLPRLTDDVSVNRIRPSDGHMGFGESKLRRICKPGHAFGVPRPAMAAEWLASQRMAYI